MYLLIILFGGVLVFQFFFFPPWFLTLKNFKIICSIPLAFFIIRNLIFNKIEREDLTILLIFTIFLMLNFFSILFQSSPLVGLKNSFIAFLYNYSLLIFIIPYYCTSQYKKKLKFSLNNSILPLIFLIILIIDLFAFSQFILKSHNFPADIIAFSFKFDSFKYDHIGDFIRVHSILKSPLEFSIFNNLFSFFFLSRFLFHNKNKLEFFLLILTSASSLLTLYRTGISMLFSGIVFIFFFWLYANSKKIRIKTILLINALFFIPIFVAITFNLHFFQTLLNPTNLYIRFSNWKRLLHDYNSSTFQFLFGSGVIQNGSFGSYHSVIIDNIYIGVFLAGGFISLFLFFIISLFFLKEHFKHITISNKHDLHIHLTSAAFFLSFLVGGITENLMHLLFYPMIILVISRFFSFKSHISYKRI